MGVANVTPDSFSDGAQATNLKDFANKVEYLQKMGADIIDVGAQSTAPQSTAISVSEEMTRLESTLGLYLDQNPNKLKWPSIDTFHPEIFDWVRQRYDGPLIWNDVSGILDQAVLTRLDQNPHNYYVYAHNLVPVREESGRHLDFINPDLTEADVANHFVQAYKMFSEAKVMDRVFFDPCFCFAKTREQSWDLLNNISNLLEQLDPEVKWLIGLSKKSFLRDVGETAQGQGVGSELERRHQQQLKKFLALSHKYHFTFRVHHPETVTSLTSSKL